MSDRRPDFDRPSPGDLANYALIGICLILIGALLTAGPVSIEQRGAVLAGIIIVLVTMAWRYSHSHRKLVIKEVEEVMPKDEKET
jgi:xanthine/uracil/vitamin C permease (AzgA family)